MNNENFDVFYDYSSFSDERLLNIMSSWDGLGGYHGLMIKIIADRIPKHSTVLDVGCGLCHLWEAMKDKGCFYTGMDVDRRVIDWAKDRYPHLPLHVASVYELGNIGIYDVVVACGLYSGEPEKVDGIKEMLKHTTGKLIITFFHKEKYNPSFLNHTNYSEVKFIRHDIDERLTIMEIYK